jgi:hypothetical protein
MAVSLPFILIGVAQLCLLQALVVALPSCAAQCFPKGGGRPKPAQMIFNLGTMALAVAAANFAGSHFAALLSAPAFFLTQSVAVAGVIRISEGGALLKIWSTIAHYSFPFYVLCAGLTVMVTSTAPRLGWRVPVLCIPILLAIYRSYESYFRVPQNT